MAHFDTQVWPTCQDERDPAVVALLGRGAGNPFSVDKNKSVDSRCGRSPPASCDEIDECHWFVAVGAWSTWADTFAKPLAVRAALLAEITRVALGAHVDDRQPRPARRKHRQLRLRVPPSPGSLPARPVTKALSPNRLKLSTAHSTLDRLPDVTQRLHLDLAGVCAGAARACVGSDTTRSRSR